MGEHHDLSTEIGRQRASIQLLVDIHQLSDSQETRESLLKKYAFVTANVSENTKSVSLAGVVSRNEVKILGQIAWKTPDRGVFSAAADIARSPNEAGQREFSQFTKAG
jgi:hypothetical protein